MTLNVSALNHRSTKWNDILAEVRRNRDFAVDLLVATAEMIGKDK
jgi:hypothetical protein